MEVLLRVFQPFEFRLKGDKIDLWPGRHYVIRVPHARRLDSLVVTQHNSLGFRGPDPPADFDGHLTVLAVGGSTTEGSLLSEGKTWPDRLAAALSKSFDRVWVDNAGLSGQSTFGHLVLMEDYVVALRPKVLLLLVGVNDVGLGRPKRADENATVASVDFRSVSQFGRSLARHSEVLGLGLNLYRYYKARQLRVADEGEVDVASLGTVAAATPEDEKARVRREHRREHLPAYRSRLEQLVTMARSHGIEPVLITAPLLYGYVRDDVTHRNLATISDGPLDSGFRWEILELYNDVTRGVGQTEGVLVIDLARELPKSSRYFYDEVHFGNEGATRVAEIVDRRLCPFLASRYPTFVTHPCPG